jgi:hypothetical protein
VTPLATTLLAAISVAGFVFALMVAPNTEHRILVWSITGLVALVTCVLVGFWGLTPSPEAAPPRRTPTQSVPTQTPAGTLPQPLAEVLDLEPSRVSAVVAGARQPSVPAYSLTARNCSTGALEVSASLGGRAERVTGSFALDDGAPAETRTLVRIVAADEEFEQIITPDSGAGFDVPLSGAQSMTIALSTVGSTTRPCRESEYDLLIVDAIVR